MSKKNKIDLSRIDLDKMKEMTTETPGLLPYAHNSGGAVIKPEDKGKIVGRALAAMESQTEMQMSQIYQQMQLLADQAKSIQYRVEISQRIYEATISFEPLINHIYYLYHNESGEDVMSLIAPEEWGRKNKPKFIAEVKLLADHTWDILRKEK